MSILLKRRHALDKRIEANAEQFAHEHPYIFFIASFIGMPICILAAVFFFTVIITAPVALLFGWL
ncbi:MAG: hypothetical protein ACI4RB_06180 [Acutalibacteraceae bacterium]